MSKITTILIDDEARARSVLASLLHRASSNIEIIASCNSLLEGVEAIKKLQPDVVFLDVKMPNYAGYEIATFFETINFDIVFVTAYDEFAIKAFELNAIDYLVKPIDRKKLERAIDKVKLRIKERTALVDYTSLLKTIRTQDHKKIVIPEMGNRQIVDLDTIIAVEADGAYSKIHLLKNKTIITSKNLKYFEDTLPQERSFFRSHRTWIINLDYLEFFNKSEMSFILANGQVKAKISRAKLEAFENVIA